MMRFRTLRFYAPDDGTGDGTSTPTDDASTTPAPEAQWQGGTITGENLEAAAAEMFKEEIDASAEGQTGEGEQTDDAQAGSTGDQADAAGTEGGGDEGAEGAQSPPSADSGTSEDGSGDKLIQDVLDLGNDVSMPKAEAIQWAAFADYLRQNPDKATAIAAVLDGTASPAQEAQAAEGTQAPTGTPPGSQTGNQAPTLSPPEGLDLDDPAIKALWEQHVATATSLSQITERVDHQAAILSQQQYASNEAMVNTARSTFAEKHHLTSDDMQKVEDVTTRMQVLPALMSPFDPLTGAPRQVDPVAAIQEGFEMARWAIPELRQRELDAQVEAAKTDNKRKAKLSSLGGSSGTAPRTDQIPNTPAGRREAMIQEVARIQSQGA